MEQRARATPAVTLTPPSIGDHRVLWTGTLAAPSAPLLSGPAKRSRYTDN